MENSTAMLANVILLTLDTQDRWVSEPRFKTQEIIDSLLFYLLVQASLISSTKR